MNEITQAIKNLEIMSKALETLSNKPENYNKYYANHLETMSWEMFKMSKELVQIGYAFGGV